MNVHISDDTTYYEHGYPIGGVLVKQGNDKPIGYALNNHLDFTVMYNEQESKDGFVIVGFEISPRRFVLFPFLIPLVCNTQTKILFKECALKSVFPLWLFKVNLFVREKK